MLFSVTFIFYSFNFQQINIGVKKVIMQYLYFMVHPAFLGIYTSIRHFCAFLSVFAQNISAYYKVTHSASTLPPICYSPLFISGRTVVVAIFFVVAANLLPPCDQIQFLIKRFIHSEMRLIRFILMFNPCAELVQGACFFRQSYGQSNA